MGGPTTIAPTSGGGGGGGGNPPPLSSTDALLKQIFDLLNSVFGLGKSIATTDVFATVGNTAGVILYTQSKIIKRGLIQNLSATDSITVFATPGGKAPANIVAAFGTVLNPAPAAGQGGGSIPIGNIDLASLTFISSTNASQSVSVYYET